MKPNSSIKKNYLMNTILNIAGLIFPLITYPYTSRILLPDGIGKVAFANSIVAYFLMFAQLGIPMYGVSVCARIRDKAKELSKTVKELFIISIITTLLSIIILAACVIAVPKLYSEKTLYIVLSVSILLQPIGIEWVFKALEQYSYITIRSLVFKVISTIAIFLLIHQKSDYLIYAGISVFSSSASYILNFIYARKLISFRRIKSLNYKRHLKGIFVFFGMMCATTIYVNLDEVMLGFLKGDTAVGLYNTAVRIRAMLLILITSLGTVILPRASYYIKQEKFEEFWQLIKKAISFVFIFSVPLTVYFVLFAKPSILLLVGDAYFGSILPMQIIIPTLFFVGISNVTGIQILIPLGKEKIVLYSVIVGAVVNCILNYFFIIKYGPAGAAFATLIAEIFVLIAQMIALKGKLGLIFKGFNYFDCAIGIIFATASSLWVYLLSLSNFLTLVISACLFFGTFYLFLFLRKQPFIIGVISNLSSLVHRHKKGKVNKNEEH